MPRRQRRRWGSGSVYQRGTRWWIKWRQDGIVCYGEDTYDSKELAQQALRQVIGDLRDGKGGPPVHKKSLPTLGEIAVEWLKLRLADRENHRSSDSDKSRWNKHLKPEFGGKRPYDVTSAEVKAFVDAKTGKVGPGTIRLCVMLLSALYTDLIASKKYPGLKHPIQDLDERTKKKMKSNHDWTKTPFIRSLDDVRRVFQVLEEPFNIMFAVGAFAGIRPGEIRALDWDNVWSDRGLLHVCRSVRKSRLGPPKNGKHRDVMVLETLGPVLDLWRGRGQGDGLLFKPTSRRGGRRGAPPTYIQEHTMQRKLQAALTSCQLPRITWYQATRHTFASQWVLEGKPIGKLAAMLGHSEAEVTERYAHLGPDLFPKEDRQALRMDLFAKGDTKAQNGYKLATTRTGSEATNSPKKAINQ